VKIYSRSHHIDQIGPILCVMAFPLTVPSTSFLENSWVVLKKTYRSVCIVCWELCTPPRSCHTAYAVAYDDRFAAEPGGGFFSRQYMLSIYFFSVPGRDVRCLG
jgi:hypothetical protein